MAAVATRLTVLDERHQHILLVRCEGDGVHDHAGRCQDREQPLERQPILFPPCRRWRNGVCAVPSYSPRNNVCLGSLPRACLPQLRLRYLWRRQGWAAQGWPSSWIGHPPMWISAQ